MRTLAATLAIGALVAIAVSRVAAGFLPGFALGVVYMLAAALIVNSKQERRSCVD